MQFMLVIARTMLKKLGGKVRTKQSSNGIALLDCFVRAFNDALYTIVLAMTRGGVRRVGGLAFVFWVWIV